MSKVKILIEHPHYYLLSEITAHAEEILKGQKRPALRTEDGIPDFVVEIDGTVLSGGTQYT